MLFSDMADGFLISGPHEIVHICKAVAHSHHHPRSETDKATTGPSQARTPAEMDVTWRFGAPREACWCCMAAHPQLTVA